MDRQDTDAARDQSLVADVHALYGKGHPVGQVSMTAAADWFVSNGFRPVSLEQEHLHSVAILSRADFTIERNTAAAINDGRIAGQQPQGRDRPAARDVSRISTPSRGLA